MRRHELFISALAMLRHVIIVLALLFPFSAMAAQDVTIEGRQVLLTPPPA